MGITALASLFRTRARTPRLLWGAVIARARCSLAPVTAASFCLHTTPERVHEVDDLGRLAFARRLDFLPGLLLLQQLF